jgi:cytidine deaminase
MDREELLARARTAAGHAYAPYSHFRVGAAVVVDWGDERRVVTGANVENASYGLTLCAERAALAAAVTSDASAGGSGSATVTQVAIACIDASSTSSPEQLTPCGACRQWLAELAPDAEYYIDGLPGAFRLADLLPLAFRAVPPREAAGTSRGN